MSNAPKFISLKAARERNFADPSFKYAYDNANVDQIALGPVTESIEFQVLSKELMATDIDPAFLRERMNATTVAVLLDNDPKTIHVQFEEENKSMLESRRYMVPEASAITKILLTSAAFDLILRELSTFLVEKTQRNYWLIRSVGGAAIQQFFNEHRNED